VRQKVVSRLGQNNVMVEAQALQVLMSRYVPLQAELTAAAWQGLAHSTTAKTLIDLSAVFGAPAGIRGVGVYVAVRDSDAGATDTWIALSPNNVANTGLFLNPIALNDRWNRGCLVVPCDVNGDIYYQISASGANTFDVYLQIWGYFI